MKANVTKAEAELAVLELSLIELLEESEETLAQARSDNLEDSKSILTSLGLGDSELGFILQTEGCKDITDETDEDCETIDILLKDVPAQ